MKRRFHWLAGCWLACAYLAVGSPAARAQQEDPEVDATEPDDEAIGVEASQPSGAARDVPAAGREKSPSDTLPPSGERKLSEDETPLSSVDAEQAADPGATPGAAGSPPVVPPAGALEGLRNMFGRVLGGADGLTEPTGEEDESGEAGRKLTDLKRQALVSFRRDRFADAIRFINELITLRPYEPQFHFALGLCYRKEGRYKEALKKYQDVLDLGGPKELIAVLKAEVFASERDREKVFDVLKEAAVGGRNVISDVQNLQLLQEFKGSTEFIRLALQLERFEVSRGRRSDPFTNPFPKPTAEPGVPGAGKASKQGSEPLSANAQAQLLRNAKRLADRIQFYVKLQDEDKAMRAYMELKEMVNQKSRITLPKILKDFQDIVAKLPDIEVQISGIRLKYYYNQAQQKLKSIREVFEDGEYARVDKLHADLQAMAKEMIAANPKYDAVAKEIIERSTRWMNRAKVRIEFDAQKPEIQGIIISGNEKMTILNERILKQGESHNGFRVLRIESNRVTFGYKGEEIPMVFRRY